METTSSLDRAHIWHPWTQMAKRAPIPIISGQGVYLHAADNRTYLDGISSWWVNLHGHGHPYIAAKIAEQALQLEQVIFADFTHDKAAFLASKLVSILPGNMSKIFYTDNGACAVDASLKMALQYWYNKKWPKKYVVCFKGGYHGDTFGAMSVTGKSEFYRPFWSHLFDVIAIDVPLPGRERDSIEQMKQALLSDDIACFIFEPLILGSGGMRIYDAAPLNELLGLCKQHDVLIIADEIMTGFGRTGALFACDTLEQKPDFILLSKGLTGGFLPLGAVACTDTVFNAFLGPDLDHAFLHGHSYAGNPIACASALASLDLLLTEGCAEAREMIASSHAAFCSEWGKHPKLLRAEWLGTILALEYKTGSVGYFQSMRDLLYQFFLDREILLRPLGNVVYVLPPYCITYEELSHIYSHIIKTLQDGL